VLQCACACAWAWAWAWACAYVHCCVLQCAAVCCSVLQQCEVGGVVEKGTRTNIHNNQSAVDSPALMSPERLQHTATHCNTLQHTATFCNTLQQSSPVFTHLPPCHPSRAAIYCTARQHTPVTHHSNTLLPSNAIHVYSPPQCQPAELQHTATRCVTLLQNKQHTTATQCNAG